MSNRKLVKAFMVFTVLAILLAVVGSAVAQPAVPDVETDVGGVVAFVVSAFQGGQYFAVGALVTMLLVFFLAKIPAIKKSDNPYILPLMTAAIAMLEGLAVEFLKEDMIWYSALLGGLLGNGNAALFWSTFGKMFFLKKDDKKKRREARSVATP